LLYAQVRNNQNTLKNARNLKIFKSEVMTTFFLIQQNHKY